VFGEKGVVTLKWLGSCPRTFTGRVTQQQYTFEQGARTLEVDRRDVPGLRGNRNKFEKTGG